MDKDEAQSLVRELRMFAGALTGGEKSLADHLVCETLRGAARSPSMIQGRRMDRCRTTLFRALRGQWRACGNRGQSSDRDPASARSVAAAFRSLPEDQREAMILVSMCGLRYQDAADVMGIPEPTVRILLIRGRTRISELSPSLAGSVPRFLENGVPGR